MVGGDVGRRRSCGFDKQQQWVGGRKNKQFMERGIYGNKHLVTPSSVRLGSGTWAGGAVAVGGPGGRGEAVAGGGGSCCGGGGDGNDL